MIKQTLFLSNRQNNLVLITNITDKLAKALCDKQTRA